MKYGRVWLHVFFTILVGVFVLLNNPGLKETKINESQTDIIEVSAEKERETARVLRVIDGDTIEVDLNNKKEMVRLIGIDAPETVDPRKTIECFGKEASQKASVLLDGKEITLESDPTQGNRDKYGRLLRYIFLDDLNFNKLMIREGFAHEYTYNFPYKHQEEFRNAEKDARENQKGLWDKNNRCYN